MASQKPDPVINAHLQDCILRLAIESADFLRLTRAILAPEILTSRIPAELYQLCLSYWDTHNRPAGDHFHDEVIRFLKQKPESEQKYYLDYVQKVHDLTSPDLSYVLGRINDFIRAREFERAAVRFAELTAQGEFAEAEALMLKAFRSGVAKFDVGLDYLRSEALPIRADPARRKHLMKTGIKPLDKVIGGFKRGQFIVWMGGYKGKKSWGCLHTAVEALRHGLTVVYVSHEITLEELETRTDKMLGALAKPFEARPFRLTRWNEGTGKFEETEIRPGRTDDWELVKKVRGRMRRFGGRLILKKYPMGSVNMRDIDGYLRHLEMEGIVPDVLINDYADIMAPLDGGKELRHQINESYIYHKRLADERNMLVVTASQVTERAVRSTRVSIKDFAEDRRKAGNVDIALGICQTEEQEEENIATIMIVAGREVPQGYKVLVGIVPRTGQFALFAKPVEKKKKQDDKPVE